MAPVFRINWPTTVGVTFVLGAAFDGKVKRALIVMTSAVALPKFMAPLSVVTPAFVNVTPSSRPMAVGVNVETAASVPTRSLFFTVAEETFSIVHSPDMVDELAPDKPPKKPPALTWTVEMKIRAANKTIFFMGSRTLGR